MKSILQVSEVISFSFTMGGITKERKVSSLIRR
jgi:hypothetical protein